jgi:hypothetical protein
MHRRREWRRSYIENRHDGNRKGGTRCEELYLLFCIGRVWHNRF